MGIGDEAWIRYHKISFQEYFLDENVFKCGQADSRGGIYLNTIFYLPGGILDIYPSFEYTKHTALEYNENTNTYADHWINDVGYYKTYPEFFQIDGVCLMYPITGCLKTQSHETVVHYGRPPKVVVAEKIYHPNQDGDALIGETMSGQNIKGKVIILYSIAKGMKPKYYKELTPEILTNRFSKFFIVLEVAGCYWLHLPIGAIKFKSQWRDKPY